MRKLILLISHDPHARAILRRALEAEGFSVGEAANSREGERTIRRVRPDASIADLQLEIVELGEPVIERLRDANPQSLFYLMTTGADALSAEFTHHFDVTGVFLKPCDPAVVTQVVKSALS
ncbi:MAG: response regulator [Candidatus Lustribacter sp.]|jgi:DNA-binding NtrC family response regulator